MRFEKAISTAICAILTRHAPAWLVRFACNWRSYLFSNFSEPNHEAFIVYGEAEDERRLAPSEDDNEARARKAHDLAHCSRHPDARHLSADKGKPRRRFSLDPFQPSKGLRPLQTPHSRNHAVPRFMSGGLEQILRDVSAPRLRAEYLLRLVLFWYVECFVSEVISPKFSFIFCQSQNVVSRNIIEFCKFYNVARLNLIFSNFIPPVLFLLYSYCIGYLLCEKFFTLHLCSFFKTFLKKYVIKV